MSNEARRVICVVTMGLSAILAGSPRVGRAFDTANTLMGIDGMVMKAGGIFRDPGSFGQTNGNDGFNTFQFGSFSVNNPITTGYGKYDAFRFQKTGTGDCCISHNARLHSDTPESVTGFDQNNQPTTGLIADSISNSYLPVIDRAAFGQQFDPSLYEIQVKFKPLLQKTTADSLGVNPYPTNPTYPNITAAVENTATQFTVGLDQQGGFVWDIASSSYKRAAEQLTYTFGTAATPINQMYVTAPKDSDGFATLNIPVTNPSAIARSFYFNYGDANFRSSYVITNGGSTLNPDSTYSDATVGYGAGFQSFGGGPVDPSNPSSKLNTPNGVSLISLGAPAATLGLSLEIKSVALTKINPGSILARIDSASGITFRFGSGWTYAGSSTTSPAPAPINGISPIATDQISRFDGNGQTNLIFNERQPDTATEVDRFLIRGAPTGSTVNATNAMVQVRAKLTQPLTNAGVAQSLTVYARDRTGNDDAAGKGADEWDSSIDLHQFNTSTMTTINIPLSTFTHNGTIPLGFANGGSGNLSNFGLYEFGGFIPAGGGMLKLEMEYMQIITTAPGVPGDYNGNGVVDMADYVLWRNGGPLQNEINTPGVVDASDYTAWRANFGNHAGSGSALGSSAAVPEPATWMLIAAALAFMGCGRRAK